MNRYSHALWLVVVAASAGCPGTDDGDAGPELDAPALDAADVFLPPTDTPALDAMPDAPPPSMPCTTVGETRVGPCGFCGEAAQECGPDMFWRDTSACLMEGECRAGTAETMTTDRCAEQTRLCSSTCSWGSWIDTRPETGSCIRGQLRFAYDSSCGPLRGRYERCSDACEYVADPGAACTDGCGDTARTTPAYAREVCVPAGTFVRGIAELYDPPRWGLPYGPEAEVYVSAFYMDVYPITLRRFDECVDAGGCFPRFFSPDPIDTVMPMAGISIGEEYCAWDGGRRIPTDAEFAKAVRGPAPRRNIYPWDGDSYRCDILPSYPCGLADAYPRRIQDDLYDGMPGSRSYYGVERLYGAGYELVSDIFDPEYYASPESRLPDPTGPTDDSFVYNTLRGTAYGAGEEGLGIAGRSDTLILGTGSPPLTAQLRCVRPVEVP